MDGRGKWSQELGETNARSGGAWNGINMQKIVYVEKNFHIPGATFNHMRYATNSVCRNLCFIPEATFNYMRYTI